MFCGYDLSVTDIMNEIWRNWINYAKCFLSVHSALLCRKYIFWKKSHWVGWICWIRWILIRLSHFQGPFMFRYSIAIRNDTFSQLLSNRHYIWLWFKLRQFCIIKCVFTENYFSAHVIWLNKLKNPRKFFLYLLFLWMTVTFIFTIVSINML